MVTQKKIKFEHIRSPKIISQFGKTSIIFGLILIILAYIFWQTWVLLGPPQFKITSPVNGTKTSQSFVNLKGSAAGGTSLSVNGSAIGLNPDGSFSIDVPLRFGPNKLHVNAANRSGKTKNITLFVYYNRP